MDFGCISWKCFLSVLAIDSFRFIQVETRSCLETSVFNFFWWWPRALSHIEYWTTGRCS